MREQFIYDTRLSSTSRALLRKVDVILGEYSAQGYRLTLRQLYYQLVASDVIPNKDSEYKRLSVLLTKARLMGLVDWDAIEDRIRQPKRPYYAHNVEDALQDTFEQYRLDRQEGQYKNVEVWVEKDALSNVLYRVTSKYGVRLMVNRGYSSISTMYEAAQRLESGDTILYFGDFDPSGLDMLRDIDERMQVFGKFVEVEPIALTREQIDLYEPPPNPAKVTDPRAKNYISQHGQTSWELDALKPEVLIELCENAILSNIDEKAYEDVLRREEKEKKELFKLLKQNGYDI